MLGTEVGQFRELYGNPDVRGAVLASVAWEVDGLGGDEWELGTAALLGCRTSSRSGEAVGTDVDLVLRSGRQFWNMTNQWQRKP